MGTEVRKRLHDVCSGFRPYSSVRVEFIDEPPDDIFANALGFYGNIKGAPAFLAFIGNTSDPNVQEKMGYTGEAAVLEATSLGLGTCWVALTYNARAVKSLVRLDKEEKLICVSPVGYTTEQWSFEEKVFTGFGCQPPAQAAAIHGRRAAGILLAGMGKVRRRSGTPGPLGHEPPALGLPA